MNRAAQALGRMAKGVPKTLTDEQRTFRAEQLALARKKRHGKPKRIAPRSHPPKKIEPPAGPQPGQGKLPLSSSRTG